MNKRLAVAIGLIVIGIFFMCFLGGFLLTSKLRETNQTTIAIMTPQFNPTAAEREKLYEIATTDIDGKLVLGDIETGETLKLEIQPLMYEWSPDSEWLYATDYQELWLISADGRTVQQITSKLDSSWVSWSPAGNRLAFFANAQGLEIYDLASQSNRSVPGTKSYRCGYQPFAWSFDQEWIIFHAGRCNSENTWVEDDIVSIRTDGSEINILHGRSYGGYPSPSPVDHKVVYSVYNNQSSAWELYLSDFTSLETSSHQIKDPEGRQLTGIKWLPDGSGFYSMPFNWWYPEIDFISADTNEITVIWKDEQTEQYPGTEWSPKGSKIVNRSNGLIIFDIATGTFSEWKEGLSNACGIQWNQDDEIVAVVVCEASGELPVTEMNIILNDGTIFRLGEDLYGGVVQIGSAQP